MATNRIFASSRRLRIAASNPTTPASGDPIRWGYRIGVAIDDEDSGGDITADFGGVYDLSVKGVDGSGNSAVAAGDAIFYVDADTPKLSKKATGYFAGFALEAVESGATTTIKVALPDSPGGGTLASGGVGTTQLADAGVTAAKLTSTLAKGMIHLPLAEARLISTNDIAAKNATDGGLLSLDTAPTFKRINGATDKNSRIAWAATGVVPIQWTVNYPPDLDDTANVTVKLLVGKDGNTDTGAVLGVAYFEGVGDTNAGGNTAAITETTGQNAKTVTIAAANVGAYPATATIEITPGTHANDAIYLYGAWLEYTRK